MPKNWDVNKKKMFYTRVVYNSKFKSVSKNEANKNIRKNVQHIGKNHGVNSDALGKVAKVQEAPIQKCNIVQGVYYNVPVINRFDSLDNEDSLSVNTCDNVLDNVRINVPKQAQKVQNNDRNGVRNRRNSKKQLQTKNKGEFGKYFDTVDNSDVVNQLVIKTSEKCLETKQVTKNSPVPLVELQSVNGLSDNSESGCTEPNLSREVPCQVVQQELTDFLHMVPVMGL